jgi:DNA mismatch repair protein MutS
MSITDYLNTNIQARTLFATHYHELIRHGDKMEGVKNYSIAVTHDENGKPVFLHIIVEGGFNKSYGIEVAESSGVPIEIIENSKRYLNLYNTQNDRKSQPLDNYAQDSLFVEKASKNSDKLNEILKAVDLNRTTPLESMQILNELVQKLG